jgi:hypothetical protein
MTAAIITSKKATEARLMRLAKAASGPVQKVFAAGAVSAAAA